MQNYFIKKKKKLYKKKKKKNKTTLDGNVDTDAAGIAIV